jgi:hypothetical protein
MSPPLTRLTRLQPALKHRMRKTDVPSDADSG